jgi:transcriptional regulator with PAS, ATPase and Fis domain
MARISAQIRRSAAEIHTDAIAALSTWNWPGNVRELESRIRARHHAMV